MRIRAVRLVVVLASARALLLGPSRAQLEKQRWERINTFCDKRRLRAQLVAERDLGRKRDAIIARYEHWYSALKASAAARRRPSHEGSFEA